MKIRITETLYLKIIENKAQAQKIIAQTNPSQEDVAWLQKTVQNPNTDIGVFSKFLFVDKQPKEKIQKLATLLKNKNIAKVVQVQTRNKIDDALNVAEDALFQMKLNKIIGYLPKNLKNEIRTNSDNYWNLEKTLVDAFEQLTDVQLKYVLKKSAGYQDDLDDFIRFVTNLADSQETYNNRLSKFSKYKDTTIIYAQEPYILLRADTIDAIVDISCDFGWCTRNKFKVSHTEDLSQHISHNIEDGEDADNFTFYVLSNTLDDRMYGVGFFADYGGYINSAYDHEDHEFHPEDIEEILNEIGINLEEEHVYYDLTELQDSDYKELVEFLNDDNNVVVLNSKEVQQFFIRLYGKSIDLQDVEQFLEKYQTLESSNFSKRYTIDDLFDIKDAQHERNYIENEFNNVRENNEIFDVLEKFFGIELSQNNSNQLLQDYENLVKTGHDIAHDSQYSTDNQLKLDLNRKKYIKKLLENLKYEFNKHI